MLLALCDYRSLDRSVVVLNKAHLDVSRLLIWWNALSVAEKNSKANANRLVSVTENAAVAEGVAAVVGLVLHTASELKKYADIAQFFFD